METLTLKVPRSEESALFKQLEVGKVQYKTTNKKGFLPTEILEVAITVTGTVIVALLKYLESRKAPSEIIIEASDGELQLTADNVKKLHIKLGKEEKEKSRNDLTN